MVKKDLKIREGKGFIEITDKTYGWITRVNLRKNPFDIELKQNSLDGTIHRYIYIDPEESKEIFKKIKKFTRENEL
ncbi:MAG: hypothetical protein WC346_04510 [Methanogenium sp.]|jgi:hypothetical protein